MQLWKTATSKSAVYADKLETQGNRQCSSNLKTSSLKTQVANNADEI